MAIQANYNSLIIITNTASVRISVQIVVTWSVVGVFLKLDYWSQFSSPVLGDFQHPLNGPTIKQFSLENQSRSLALKDCICEVGLSWIWPMLISRHSFAFKSLTVFGWLHPITLSWCVAFSSPWTPMNS